MTDHKPTLVLIACQFIYSGVTLTGRAALLQDMSPSVFVVYRQSIAFLFIAPVAFLTRSKTKSCQFGWKNFWLISLLSLVGVSVNQNIYFEGLYLASSSAASALGNLVPAITFIIAYGMGLERINLRSWRSLAKIIGTIFCVSGAISMAFLKGAKLLNMEFSPKASHFLEKGQNSWLLGCLLLFASACLWSLWLILQAHVSASYPDHISLTTWMCLIAAFQSGILALAFQPNIQSWKLNSSLQLISCLYTGLASAVTFFAQAWCISRRGPLFSAMFNPLCTVIVTIYACTFMHEELYIGSLVGAIFVMIGLYTVLWGKADDLKEIREEKDNPVKKQNEQASFDGNFSEHIISCTTDLEDPLLYKQ